MKSLLLHCEGMLQGKRNRKNMNEFENLNLNYEFGLLLFKNLQ